MSGKYFANNWKEYKDAPDETFIPHTYEEVMMWKIHGWQFRPDVKGVIRVRNLKTNKVREYTYKQQASLLKKFVALMESDKDYEIVLGTNDEVAVYNNTDEPYYDF